MTKTDNMPMWVYLAFSGISTRKGALTLIWSCIVFSMYCIPWLRFFPNKDWVGNIFMIEDWSWFAMMVPIVAWYWLCIKLMDNHSAWTAEAGLFESDDHR